MKLNKCHQIPAPPMQLLPPAPTSKVIGVRGEAQNVSFANSDVSVTHPEPIIENCNSAQTSQLRYAISYVQFELMKIYRSSEEGTRDRAFAAFFKNSRNVGPVTRLLADMIEQRRFDGVVDQRIRFVCAGEIPALMHRCVPGVRSFYQSSPPKVFICPPLFQLPVTLGSPTCPVVRDNRFVRPAGDITDIRSNQGQVLILDLIRLCQRRFSSDYHLGTPRYDIWINLLNRAMGLGPDEAVISAPYPYIARALSFLFKAFHCRVFFFHYRS